MNSAQEFLAFAEYAALVLFCLSFFLTIYRVIVAGRRCPTGSSGWTCW